MKVDTLQDALAEVASYHGRYQQSLSSGREASASFRASGHARVYKVIADAYALALLLLEEPEVLASLLATWNVNAAKADENPFGPIVRLLFRGPVKGGGTIFNKSAWKYGGVMRYCRDAGWDPSAVPERLANLRLEIDGRPRTKLQAAELADRAQYKEDEDDAREEAFAYALMMESEGLARFASSDIVVEGLTDGQLINVALSWDVKTGEWVVRNVIGTNSEAVWRAARSSALAAYKAQTEKLFRDLAVHNEVVGELEAELSPVMGEVLKFHKEKDGTVTVAMPDEQKRRAKSAHAHAA